MKNVLPVFELYISSVSKLLSGIASYAKNNADWHLALTCDKREGLPEKWRGDGLLLQRWPAKEMLEFMKARPGVPSVSLVTGKPVQELKLAVVAENHNAIGQVAARYFLSCGHESFCWYGHPNRNRGVAFANELKKAGISKTLNIPPARNRTAVAEWLSERLRALPLPCAVFCENDAWARELLDVALTEGFEIPKQLSILGVDNEPALCESSFVQLSSIENRLETVGYEAAALLDKLMDGATVPEKPILIEPLPFPVARGSTDALASENPLTRAAVDFMREKRGSQIDIGDVAKALCLSESGLRKLLARTIGMSPKKLLTDLRLELASRLLRDGVKPLDEVALKAGFGDCRKLRAAFKARSKGAPPKRLN